MNFSFKRNGGPGSAEEDWAQAEKIVKGYNGLNFLDKLFFVAV
jgi:hypothetical protein